MRELAKNEISEVNGGGVILAAVATAFVVGVVVGYVTQKIKKASRKTADGGCAPTC